MLFVIQEWVKQNGGEIKNIKLKNKGFQTTHEYTESYHWNAFICQCGIWMASHCS